MISLHKKKKEDCCGCRACEQICPQKCIMMEEDTEGFLYPHFNETDCIHCDLCIRVCPFENRARFNQEATTPQAYLLIHKNEEIRFQSASGGAFTAIAQSFCTRNYIVFGVEFDKNMNVVHTYTEDLGDIHEYRKSKYVQSNIQASYQKAKVFLDQGKRVLFTGTPCQIAGLRLFLNKNYLNLLCVDIVCHGVPSQKVFNHYLDYLQVKYGGKVSSFTFRHKQKDQGIYHSKNIRAVIKKRSIVIDHKHDYYLQGYHSALFYRPSCYQCQYASNERISDITIADFWGVEQIHPDEDMHKGISAVLINTNKGGMIKESIRRFARMEEVDIQFVIQNNSQLKHPVLCHKKRETFFHSIKEKPFSKAIRMCIKQEPILRHIFSRLLTKKMKAYIIEKMNST